MTDISQLCSHALRSAGSGFCSWALLHSQSYLLEPCITASFYLIYSSLNSRIAPTSCPVPQLKDETSRVEAEEKEERSKAKEKKKTEKQWEANRETRVGGWRDFMSNKKGGLFWGVLLYFCLLEARASCFACAHHAGLLACLLVLPLISLACSPFASVCRQDCRRAQAPQAALERRGPPVRAGERMCLSVCVPVCLSVCLCESQWLPNRPCPDYCVLDR